MKLILASSSPRRRELLSGLGLSFDVISSDVDESFEPGTKPVDVVKELARRKAFAVANQVKGEHSRTLVIGADTIVVHQNQILGKPKDEHEAIQMLKSLQGNTHEVWTAVCVVQISDLTSKTEAECTQVEFVPLTDEEVQQYVQTGEPMDKAGAYGIQKIGALLVAGIEGDYFTVVGLPVRKTAALLKEFGVDVLSIASRDAQTK